MKRATHLLALLLGLADTGVARGNGNGEPPLPGVSDPTAADLGEGWNSVESIAGWYAYVAGTPLGLAPDWHSAGGVDDTPFVSWEVSTLRDWPAGFWGFYPLYTLGWTNYANANPVDLLRTPTITVGVHATPAAPGGGLPGTPANLQGGELRFWIAEWNSKTNHAVYSWRRDAFELGTGGWLRSSVTVSPDPAGWDVHALAGTPHSLPEILARPQQWGFAIIGATPGARPTGRIGFDELRIARRFRASAWDARDGFSGWYQAGDPLDRELAGGVEGAGFAVSTLAPLYVSPATNVRYPLWTLGAWPGVPVHPVNLNGNNVLEIAVNARPASSTHSRQAEPADLKGGTLEFFVGRHVNDERWTFYRFRRQRIETGSGGWQPNRLVLTASPADWEAYIRGPSTPIPLTDLLADPQCWGVGLFGCTSTPSGRLGFDRLTLHQQTHTWNRADDRNDWRAGADPAGNGPLPGWARSGGVNDSGHLVLSLAEIPAWAAPAPGLRCLLSTAPDRCWANLHEKRRVRVSLNRTPTPLTVVAGLGGGRLTCFVGRWDSADSHAFYVLRKGFPAVTSGGWSEVELELTPNPADWLIVDSQPEASATAGPRTAGRVRYPLVELLRSPQQWGLAILEAMDAPTGMLGIDALELGPPEEPAPILVPRRTVSRFQFTWPASVASATEVLSSRSLTPEAEWSVVGVWEDDLFGPRRAWRVPPPGPRGEAEEGVWGSPISSDASFFRLRSSFR